MLLAMLLSDWSPFSKVTRLFASRVIATEVQSGVASLVKQGGRFLMSTLNAAGKLLSSANILSERISLFATQVWR